MIKIKLETKKDCEWAIGFLLGKLLFLYWKMDPKNFDKNRQKLEEEMNISLGNYKNEKPNTSDI